MFFSQDVLHENLSGGHEGAFAVEQNIFAVFFEIPGNPDFGKFRGQKLPGPFAITFGTHTLGHRFIQYVFLTAFSTGLEFAILTFDGFVNGFAVFFGADDAGCGFFL
jgi:hypothetical protein